MDIKDTKLNIVLTVREAQSFITIFSSVVNARSGMADLRGIPKGMLDDIDHALRDLNNLLGQDCTKL